MEKEREAENDGEIVKEVESVQMISTAPRVPTRDSIIMESTGPRSRAIGFATRASFEVTGVSFGNEVEFSLLIDKSAPFWFFSGSDEEDQLTLSLTRGSGSGRHAHLPIAPAQPSP